MVIASVNPAILMVQMLFFPNSTGRWSHLQNGRKIAGFDGHLLTRAVPFVLFQVARCSYKDELEILGQRRGAIDYCDKYLKYKVHHRR